MWTDPGGQEPRFQELREESSPNRGGQEPGFKDQAQPVRGETPFPPSDSPQLRVEIFRYKELRERDLLSHARPLEGPADTA